MSATGWLQLVGPLKSQVSFAEYSLFNRALLQKRPIILRSLLFVAAPYLEDVSANTPNQTHKRSTSPGSAFAKISVKTHLIGCDRSVLQKSPIKNGCADVHSILTNETSTMG